MPGMINVLYHNEIICIKKHILEFIITNILSYNSMVLCMFEVLFNHYVFSVLFNHHHYLFSEHSNYPKQEL